MSTLEAKLLISIGNVSSTNNILVTRSAVSSSGDIYVTGRFKGTLDIGGAVPPINSNSTGINLIDGTCFIAKYNRDLIPISLVGMNGDISSDNSTGFSIAISSSGEVYVTGSFNGTLNIGDMVPPIISTSTRGSGFIAKYNRDLNPILSIGMNGTKSSENSAGISIAISSSGEVYITGLFMGTLNIGDSVKPIISTSNKSSGFIARYNRNLNPIFLIGMNGTKSSDYSGGLSIAISSTGEIYVTGLFEGTLNIGDTVQPIITTGAEESGFIAKYNNILKPIYLNIMDATVFANGLSIAISSSGEVYVTGVFIGTLNIGGITQPIISSISTGDGFIAKYNNMLTPISLIKITGTKSSDYSGGTSIAISSSGEVYVTGLFGSTLNIGDGTDNDNIYTNIFIAKYNSALKSISLDLIVSDSSFLNDELPTIAISQSGDLYIVGSFSGTVDIGNNVPSITNNNSGVVGGFIAKYLINDNICFHKGTMILTPNGYKAVESLNRGDLVTTAQGRVTKIVDITSFVGKSDRCPLYILRKGALGKDKPLTDLYMSEGHAYRNNGRWCHMKCSSTAIKLNDNNIEYYNIILDNYLEHTLVANGVEVESLFKIPGLDMRWNCKKDDCKPIITRKV
jgi:hypothetical protein